MKRLNKFLAECGVDSRRKCDLLIQSGRVAVNGKIVRTLGIKINEGRDTVTVDGKSVHLPQKFKYILLNKPQGSVTTVQDEFGRKTVLDLLPKDERVFPVGRLDKDTTGALLLTNDGELAFRLTHPKFKVEKTYQVAVSQPVSDYDLQKIASGIMLEDGITRSCQIKFLDQSRRNVELVLKEGRKREIKRMFKALGNRVIKLKRIKFAFLTTENLAVGNWRYLTEQEVERLKLLVSGESSDTIRYHSN